MDDRLNKTHAIICILYWVLWIIGLLFIGVSLLVYQNDNRWFFENIVHPYNSLISILSLIPIEPILCIVAFTKNIITKKSLFKIIRPLIWGLCTIVFFMLYAFIFVVLTGGV